MSPDRSEPDPICAAIAAPETRESELAELMEHLGGRAIGLWCVAGDRLLQLGFAAVPDMPEETREAFRELTRSVPLAETGYGIVSAVVNARVTPARRETGRLTDSESWLARFESESSLSVPFGDDTGIVGVLAMSSPEVLTAGSGAGAELVRIAGGLRVPLSGLPDQP